jgi:hypothetical protein
VNAVKMRITWMLVLALVVLLGHQHVGGLDVAVDDTLPVGVLDRVTAP